MAVFVAGTPLFRAWKVSHAHLRVGRVFMCRAGGGGLTTQFYTDPAAFRVIMRDELGTSAMPISAGRMGRMWLLRLQH